MDDTFGQRPINLEMIVSRNCSSCNGTNNKVEDAVLRLKRIWLDKMGITQIDNLEMLGNVTHIHLDFNSISIIENLETVSSSLQHLSLKGNKISDIGEGLISLSKLMSLDLSENRIGTITSKQVPANVSFLNLLDNPVIENSAFNEDSFLKEFPNMKVYNKNVLNAGEDSDEDSEGESDQNDIDCLQDLTSHLKESSRARQATIEENHQQKITTLALLKTEMMSAKETNSLTCIEESGLRQDDIRANQLDMGCMPLLDRPLSSQSLTKRSGQLKPLPSRKTSSPALSRLKSPNTPKSQKQVARLNSPKRIADKSDSGASNTSLRQPLEMELVKVDDFDNYLVDVNKKFSDIRSNFQGL